MLPCRPTPTPCVGGELGVKAAWPSRRGSTGRHVDDRDCTFDVAFVDFDVPTNIIIGEFEQLVLLGILRLGDAAYALPLRESLGTIAGRRISRGALYRTLDRLADKGLLTWDVEDVAPARGGLPRRKFRVTAQGAAALRRSRRTLLKLWDEVAEALG